MNFKYETDRLVLRVLNRKDERLVQRFYDKNLIDFSHYEPIDYSSARTLHYYGALLDAEQSLIIKGDLIRYYVFEKKNPFSIVGTLSFRNFEDAKHLRSCTVGYKVAAEYRRRGYATEMLTFACNELFIDRKMHRINAYVMTDNKPSCQLLEKIGFEREGLVRKNIMLNGVWCDHYLYGLINE